VDEQDVKQHLSQITTHWTMVFQSHRDSADSMRAAQEILLQRYCGAIYRYLASVLRNTDAAEELCQEFALRFVRGYFKGADPGRGRFRDYVKRTLFHLIADYRNKRQAHPQPLPDESLGPTVENQMGAASDEEFLNRWREALLNRAWEALAAFEKKTGSPVHTVLRLRAEQPKMSSDQMAEQLGIQLGRPLTAANTRQTLHRAREKFADLLLDEVARSLQSSAPERLEEELVDLGLLPYCQTALRRRAGKSTKSP
jgi:RNA polymerase sigma-70 factor (ECF subfamily)